MYTENNIIEEAISKINNFGQRQRVNLFLYFITLIFSFLINFSIDVLVYDRAILSNVGYYFMINLPTQIFLVFFYVIIVNKFNGEYWKTRIRKRLLLELLSIFILANLVIIMFTIFITNYSNYEELLINMELSYTKKFFYVTFVQSIVVVLFLEIAYLFLKTQKDELKYEKIKNDIEKFRYYQLKSQINPHFLFNSLNVLSALIYEKDTDKSIDYVDKLSNLYRYFLSNEEKDIISLKDEMNFTKDYIDILSVRYGESLKVIVNIDKSLYDKKIIPASLQLLIENACKHNLSSNDNRLVINIFSENNYIVVGNLINIQVENVKSTGIGLINLEKKYNLKGEKIVIIKSDKEFIVKIPMI